MSVKDIVDSHLKENHKVYINACIILCNKNKNTQHLYGDLFSECYLYLLSPRNSEKVIRYYNDGDLKAFVMGTIISLHKNRKRKSSGLFDLQALFQSITVNEEKQGIDTEAEDAKTEKLQVMIEAVKNNINNPDVKLFVQSCGTELTTFSKITGIQYDKLRRSCLKGKETLKQVLNENMER